MLSLDAYNCTLLIRASVCNVWVCTITNTRALATRPCTTAIQGCIITPTDHDNWNLSSHSWDPFTLFYSLIERILVISKIFVTDTYIFLFNFFIEKKLSLLYTIHIGRKWQQRVSSVETLLVHHDFLSSSKLPQGVQIILTSTDSIPS